MSFPTFPLFVILQEGHPCPKLQNPMLSKAEKNLLPWGEGTRHGGWGAVKHTDSRPSPTVSEAPPSPGGRGLMARSWILRLRLEAARRMTALLEGSKNQMGMMGGFSPVLVEQILLT